MLFLPEQISSILSFYKFVTKIIKFCIWNLENGNKDKNGSRYTTLGFENE